MRLFKLSLPLVFILLAGCAGVNSQFDCNKIGGKGVGCVSMSKVNQMADQGLFRSDEKLDTVATRTNIHINSGIKSNKSLGFDRNTITSGRPTRTLDEVDRIWIAPWKDKGDNYHDSSFIYTVITYSHWNDYPVSAIQSGD